MKRVLLSVALLLVIAITLGAGFWWGRSDQHTANTDAHEQPPTVSAEAPSTRKILYYRNPMGLPDTSPEPKKDSMGMDYIPVYEGEETTTKVVKLTLDKLQKLGVKTEVVTRRALMRTVRAVGTLEAAETQVITVAPKFEGWIEKLYVNATGATVKKGDELMDVYSPELVSAQQEYVIAFQGAQSLHAGSADVQAGMQRLAKNSLERLRNWGIPEAQIERLRSEGQVHRELTLRAPTDGVVLEKNATQGMRFMPGETLYKLADLSSLWLIAKVFEQDLGLVRPGQNVRITVNAYPAEVFKGKVAFIYPTLDAQTRTAPVRIELPNPGGVLKPAMYANVELMIPHAGDMVLSVPDSAVLDTGTRQLVLIERGEGLFEPREVKLGMRADGYVEVLDGVSDGDKAVVRANFLIDAESNLKAALGGLDSKK